MRICVENGMFTVSFLREGIQKVRSLFDTRLSRSDFNALIVVSRMVGRPPQDILGSVQRRECSD